MNEIKLRTLLPIENSRPLKDKLKSLGDSALSRSPAQPLFLWRAARRLAVLGYHGINDPQKFESHLDYIKRKMHPVSLQDVLSAIKNGGGLPSRAVLLTFDDGDRSLIEHGLPAMKRKAIPGVAFIIAGLLGTSQRCWWNEVKQLIALGGKATGYETLSPEQLVRALKCVDDQQRLRAIKDLQSSTKRPASPYPQIRLDELGDMEAAGMAVGNHSLTHPCLPRCSEEKVRREIIEAHGILSSALGRNVESFAYPNGDFDPRAEAVLAELGYEAAFLFDHKINRSNAIQRFEISRLRVDSDATLDRFRIIISGLHPALYRIRTKQKRRDAPAQLAPGK